ncbi:MAG TPA: hypothetical protein VF345_08780 [Chthoniobacterales bacterium]
MKHSLACFLIALSLTAPALADTLKIPEDKPVASITFPEGWKAAVTSEGISASSEDGTVFIDVITTNPTILGASIDKAFALLHVKPDIDTWKDTKSTMNGMNVVQHTLDAKDDKGNVVKLTLTGVEVTKEKGVLVILRGTAEGQKEHEAEVTAIMESIAAVK